MLFSPERDKLRLMYVEAWRKHRQGLPMQALEGMIAEVVALHPEYHALLEDAERALGWEETPGAGLSHPFLHMGLHIALREQLGMDRPAGLRAAYERLAARLGDAHEAEHRLMACLLQALDEAGPQGPDEQAYLACVRRLL